MYKLFSLFLLFIFVSIVSKGNPPIDQTTDFYNSIIEKLASEDSSLNSLDKKFMQSIEVNVPNGNTTQPVPPDCHPFEFQSQSLTNYQNSRHYAEFSNDYISRCSKYLTQGNVLGLPGVVKLVGIQYDIKKNPNLSFMTLTLSDGNKLDSIIGIKDTINKRPWVILKCGVFCDISSSATVKSFIINFFDQSPFNIIFLSNYTGVETIQKNESLRMGGFNEVYDLYDVAKWLKNESPFRNTIDSIHAAGISLGGSAALAVSKLRSLSIPNSTDKPLFNSTTAICPVVNLKPTLNDMYTKTFKGKVFTAITWALLMKSSSFLSEAKDYLSTRTPPDSSEFPHMLGDIAFRYGKIWELSSPPGRLAPVPTDIEDFLNKNKFSEDLNSFEIPTFAWASFDDRVVRYDLNSKTLVDNINLPQTIGAFGVPEGHHCGFDSAYGFLTTTSILQTFIINNSPHFKVKRRIHYKKLPEFNITFSSQDLHLGQSWKIIDNSNVAQLKFEVFNPTLKFICKLMKPYESPNYCRKVYTQDIALNDLSEIVSKFPESQIEAQILTRKLNGQIRVTNNQTPIDGTHNSPNQISWSSFE